jgi:hypothetical protein
MSDDTGTPGASALMNGAPAEPRSVSTEQAYARLNQMRNSPDIQVALAKGDKELTAELKNLIAQTRTPSGIQVGVVPDGTPQARADIADTWAGFADLPAEVLQQVRERRPVSTEEYQRAAAEKKQLFRDKEWVRKYFDGDRAARRQMALISIILGSEVRAP